MSDYRLEVRVKNALLMNKINDAGFKSVAAFSRATGFSQLTLSLAINLKLSLYTKQLTIRSFPQRLADYFMCEPVELFPEEIWLEPIENNKSVKEIDAEQMFLANNMREDGYGSIEYIENEIDDNSQVNKLLLKIRNDRDRDIVESKLYEGKNFNEIGDDYDLSRERVRQLYSRGIRDMRKDT